MTSAANDPTTLDLYKLGAELADRVSARRATVNSFFLTVQTTLIAVVALVAPALTGQSDVVGWVAAAAGVLLSASWWLILRSYRELNAAKFTVLQKIEQDLPVRLFGDEWDVLQNRPPTWKNPRYAELGAVERAVPWIFAVLWVGLPLAQALTQ